MFMEESIADPSVRDQISILYRNYQNKIKVLEDDKLLFADYIIQIDPLAKLQGRDCNYIQPI